MRTADREDDSPAADRRSVLQSVGAAGALGPGAAAGETVRAAVSRDSPSGSEEPLTARGSVEQVPVWHAEPGATVTLSDSDGEEVAEGQADELGSYLFAGVEPGPGYQVTQAAGDESTDPVEVLPVEYTPPQDLYDGQTLSAGFGYIEVRDGTTLAGQVLLPDGPEPPYPTLVIYSGYEPSVQFPGGSVIEDVVVQEYGYAVVGVNMRGSACSGGRFKLGEALQSLDGYDVVETVAAQDWADGVALAGASFSGFTQLYVAATQPPSLDAIVPGHPIGEFYRDTVYPGGMRNVTFAQGWAGNRDSAFEPYGEAGNVDQRIADGDETCAFNQLLRHQNERMAPLLVDAEYYNDLYQERGPFGDLDHIDVPTLLVVCWQDEQTGGRAARLFERLSGDIPARLLGTNGDHFEYLSDDVLGRLDEFLTFYVEEAVPAGYDGPYEEALAEYESEPVTVTWERDQADVPRAETAYAEWPPAGVETWNWYLQPGGGLGPEPPETGGIEATSYEFESPPSLLQLIGRDDQGRLVWEPQAAGTDAGFVSEPLSGDRVCLGSGFVEVWLRSTGDDTDLQVTLSEVRPDGQEQFVQTGWLRASHRAEDGSLSRPRRPWHTHSETDLEPMPDGEFVRMRVELFPFGHVFREGSRLRVAVENPGGNRDLWAFSLVDETTNEVAHAAAYPSRVALPLLPDETVDVPADPPPCGTVRHQPCRSVDLPERGTVSGTVTDADGPLTLAEVSFTPTGETTGRTTTTDAAGTYDAALVPGTYDAVVDLPSYERFEVTLTVEAGATETLDVELSPAVPPVVGPDPPADLDADGRFEDIDGDGVADIFDVQALFEHLHDDPVQDNPAAFDFDDSGGRPDIFDVQALFERL